MRFCTTRTVPLSSMQLTPGDISSFHRNGYVLIQRVLASPDLQRAREAALEILDKAESGSYPHYRIYDDLLPLNIAGVEHLFHPTIFSKELFQSIICSGVLRHATSVLESYPENADMSGVALTINRLICTTRYQHSGFWHRDGRPGEADYVLSALYLYDEQGFVIVPGSHLEATPDDTIQRLRESPRARLPGEIRVGGSAGDLLLFHPSLLHRGSSRGYRTHIHQGFKPVRGPYQFNPHQKEWVNRDEVYELCDEEWKRMLSNCIDGDDNSESPSHRAPSLKTFTRRFILTALYYLLAYAPEDSKIFNRMPLLTPHID